MKKVFALILAFTLLLSSAALAQTFTHPETGEEVTMIAGKAITYDNIDYEILPNSRTPLGSGAVGMPLRTALPAVLTAYLEQVEAGIEGDVTIEHFDELFGDDVLPDVLDLPLVDQGWALLYAMGMKDEVRNSPDYANFSEALLATFEKIDDTRNLNNAAINRYFPINRIMVDGKSVRQIAITLQITDLDSTERYERYSFIEQNGVWMFYNAMSSAIG